MNADMVAILDFCIDLDTHSRLITAQIVPFLWQAITLDEIFSNDEFFFYFIFLNIFLVNFSQYHNYISQLLEAL